METKAQTYAIILEDIAFKALESLPTNIISKMLDYFEDEKFSHKRVLNAYYELNRAFEIYHTLEHADRSTCLKSLCLSLSAAFCRDTDPVLSLIDDEKTDIATKYTLVFGYDQNLENSLIVDTVMSQNIHRIVFKFRESSKSLLYIELEFDMRKIELGKDFILSIFIDLFDARIEDIILDNKRI